MTMTNQQPFSAATWTVGRSLADPRLSPDGEWVAFVTASADRAELAVMPLNGGAEYWLPLEPPVKRASSSGGSVFDWLADGSGFVYLGTDGCLHCYNAATHQCRAITHTAQPLSALAVSPTGTHAAFVIDTADVAVVALSGDQWPQRLSSGADFCLDPTWSPDGRFVAWHEWDVPAMPWDSGRIVVRRADGSDSVITVAGGEITDGEGISVGQPRFSPDGHHLAFVCDANGWVNVWVVDVPLFDNARPVVSEQFEHAGPTWGPGQRTYCWAQDGGSIVVARNEAGFGRLCRLSLENGENGENGLDGKNDKAQVVEVAQVIADGTFSGLSARKNTVVAIGNGPQLAATLMAFTLDPRAQRPLVRGPVGGLERAGVVPEAVTWQADDGTTLHGRLYQTQTQNQNQVPDDCGQELPPLLVWIHGGPAGQSPATLYARWAYFLERGWSVLVVDYRGTSGWGRAYLQALRGKWGELDVADVASAMRAAAANGWGDATKMVPIGSSAGGFTTLHLLAQYRQLCAAGVALYPVTDLLDFGDATYRYEEHYLDSMIGPLPQAHGQYLERSPLRHASAIGSPLLLIHGDEDPVVPVGQSTAMADAVRRNGGVVELHIYQGEGHGWRRAATLVDELQRVERFLRTHVLLLAPTKGNS